MTLKELEEKKTELRTKIENANAEELETLKSEVEALKDVEIEEEKEDKREEQEEVDERSLLKGAIERLEVRKLDLDSAKKIEKPNEETNYMNVKSFYKKN